MMKKMGILWLLIFAFTFLMVPSVRAVIDYSGIGVADDSPVEELIQITPGDPNNPTANVRDWIPCWGVNPWSYDGDWIVYQSQIGGGSGSNKNEICIIRADGTNYQRLTNDSTCDSHGNFTPDDTRIIFQREPENDARIWIMDRDGSNQQNLTQAHGGPIDGACEQKPMVSPDGTKIAFRTCAGSGHIWVMNIDGTSPVKVSGSLSDCTKHSWSPDSQWILFNSQVDYTNNHVSRIFKVRPTGADLTMLSENVDAEFCENWAAWSPDGDYITYHHRTNDSNDYSEIWIMRPDGTEKEVLVSAIPDEPDPEEEWVCGPHSWSPDSEWIVFKKWLSDSPLFIINIDTREIIQLTEGYRDGRMWWGPDGTHILFKEYTSGPYRDGNQYNYDMLVLTLNTEGYYDWWNRWDDDEDDFADDMNAIKHEEGGGCFITTSVSGSPLAGEVEIMRWFVQRGAEVCCSIFSQWTSCLKSH